MEFTLVHCLVVMCRIGCVNLVDKTLSFCIPVPDLGLGTLGTVAQGTPQERASSKVDIKK